MLILILSNEASTLHITHACILNRSSKGMTSSSKYPIVQSLMPVCHPIQFKSFVLYLYHLKSLDQKEIHMTIMSDLDQVREALALPMPSVPVSSPKLLGKTAQITSLISIQKCEKLKAKNFTSAGKWQKVANM